MIVERNNNTWEVISSNNISLIPYFVEVVAMYFNGETLIYDYKGDRIKVNVSKAINNKLVSNDFALKAKESFDCYNITKNKDSTIRAKYEEATKQAGKHYFLYLAEMKMFGPKEEYPPIPYFIAQNNELKEIWEDEFFRTRRRLYDFTE